MIRNFLKARLGLLKKTHLRVGGALPAIDCADATGKRWSAADLRGRNAVIYFYPADDTPGCTKEACSFRDHHGSLGAQILGVSTDNADSHRAFASKFNLPFPLLADTDGAMSRRFGVLDGNARRATFIVDREGRIAAVFDPVKVEGHTDQVRSALTSLP